MSVGNEFNPHRHTVSTAIQGLVHLDLDLDLDLNLDLDLDERVLLPPKSSGGCLIPTPEIAAVPIPAAVQRASVQVHVQVQV